MIVYQAHNPVTNSFYVGQTSRSLWARRARHAKDADSRCTKSVFHKAIRKYGIDAFSWCVLEYVDSKESMDASEKRWIRMLRECGHKCYNLRPGGDGGSFPGAGNPNFGKSTPDSVRDKISASLKKHYAKHPGTMTGRKGETAPAYGKPMSKEVRLKLSQAHKGKAKIGNRGAGNGSAVAIRCVTTGEHFPYAKAAAEKYDSDLSSIIKCCKGKVKSVRGRVYEYVKPGVFGWTAE